MLSFNELTSTDAFLFSLPSSTGAREKNETVLEGNINTPGLGRGQAPTGLHPKHPGCHSNLFAWILIVCQILYWEYFNHSGSTNSLLGGGKKILAANYPQK